MKRQEWTFDFKAGDLLGAALNKQAKHRTRLKVWEKEKAAVMKRIRSVGLTVEESLKGAGYSNISGRGTQVRVDEKMQHDLDEAQGKISEHRGKLKEFEAWVAVLSVADKATLLPVTAADHIYFFGE